MNRKTLNIVIGGEAGQGLVTIGQLLAKTLVKSGYEVVVTQSYESRIRGGHNTFTIRTGAEPLESPQEAVDLLIALNEETVQLHRDELSTRGFVVTDAGIQVRDFPCFNVPFKELASARYENVVAFGVVTHLLGLDESLPAAVLERLFGKKGPKVVEENRKALADSYRWAMEQSSRHSTEQLDILKLPAIPPDRPPRMLLNGNEALGLGALSAGVKFCAFYPMTPSTSISLTLIAHSKRMGVVVEQAEDEIAAINMALGASFTGVPSMVTTSGGGFALMVEGVSLAGMTETPVVVMLAQRPGPATSLPTRTEQGDLELVLYAGHGEFPRAILAPGSVEECFHLARQAFFLAERYHGPVFVLTDQFLADSYRAVAPFDVAQLATVQQERKPLQVEAPYRRYALTDDGISPRLFPGLTQHLVVADSDEHDEAGHLTEDLSIRVQMVDKRLKKHEGFKRDVIPPDYAGDDQPEVLLLSWGTTRGAAAEAASELRSQGKSVATLHFQQVWPLLPDQFTDRLSAAGEVVCIESNATGQFAALIRRETGFDIPRHVRRYDGLPITPEYILGQLNL